MPNLPNGQYSPGSETIGSIRQISCHNGYELDGSSMIFCLANETWTKPGSCIQRIVTCENTPTINNGVVLPGGNQIGSIRQVQCNSGYEGSFSIHCLQNGNWSIRSSCQRSMESFQSSIPVSSPLSCCNNLPSVTNGRINSGSSEVGSVRDIHCNSGYQLNGNRQIFCGQNGIWTLPGTCTPVPQNQGSSETSRVKLAGSKIGHNGEGYILVRQHDGQWGSICGDHFGFNEAEVVCKMLGFE